MLEVLRFQVIFATAATNRPPQENSPSNSCIVITLNYPVLFDFVPTSDSELGFASQKGEFVFVRYPKLALLGLISLPIANLFAESSR